MWYLVIRGFGVVEMLEFGSHGYIFETITGKRKFITHQDSKIICVGKTRTAMS